MVPPRGLHAGKLIPHGSGNPYARLDIQQRCILRHRMHKRHPHCAYCGRRVSRRRSTLDHVRPVVRGGRSIAANLVLSCRDCNQAKGDRTAWEWALRLVIAAAVIEFPWLRCLVWPAVVLMGVIDRRVRKSPADGVAPLLSGEDGAARSAPPVIALTNGGVP